MQMSKRQKTNKKNYRVKYSRLSNSTKSINTLSSKRGGVKF